MNLQRLWRTPLVAAGCFVSLLARADVPNDFDGDQLSDLCVYNPADGYWTFRLSQGGTWTGDQQSVQFGFPGTCPLTGDFDGDGTTDQAVYYPPQSRWFLAPSGGGTTNFTLGRYGSIPLVADFDGDGLADAACYDPAKGLWNIRRSRDGAWSPQYGFPGTLPVAADYDGDGRADLAVMNTADYTWYIQKSSGGGVKTNFGGSIRHTAQWDIPTPMFLDFDDDGRADLGVMYDSVHKYHISGTVLDVLRSSNGPAECVLGGNPVGLGSFSVTGRMEGAWQYNDFDTNFYGVHLFAVSPGSAVTNKIRTLSPDSSRAVLTGIPQARRQDWPFLSPFFPLPSSGLNGRTASGQSIKVQISATSVPLGLATVYDGRGGSARATMNVLGDYMLLDSPGTPASGPITMVANKADIRTQSYPTPWVVPGGFYDLPIYVMVTTFPATYRDNRGETTVNFSQIMMTIAIP